jgi:uncharacterized protein with FMN-binding domain
MKDIVRMAIILAVICAVAAGALAFTNQVTSAIIEQRIYDETVAELQVLFPDLADFTPVVIQGRSGIQAFDAGGNLVGVLAQGRTGTILFNLGVNADGEIVGLTILQQSETAGLGDKITAPSFLANFIGKSVDDDFGTIDNISGATVSANAMKNGVPRELQDIMVNFMDAEAPVTPTLNLADVADGTYEGTAAGRNDDITVAVTVAGGKITSIEVVSHAETPSYFDRTGSVIDQIIEEQTVQVDAASGATLTSDGIMNAVLNALTQ